MTDRPISLAFALLADLGNKSDASPLNKFDGCWEKQLDENWWFAINGHKNPVICSNDAEVPPYHCYVEWCGWPAGLLNPYGGTLAAGSMANEDTFIEALKTAGAAAPEASQ